MPDFTVSVVPPIPYDPSEARLRAFLAKYNYTGDTIGYDQNTDGTATLYFTGWNNDPTYVLTHYYTDEPTPAENAYQRVVDQASSFMFAFEHGDVLASENTTKALHALIELMIANGQLPDLANLGLLIAQKPSTS